MENKYFANDAEESGLSLTPQSLDFLRETAKWAKFLSILGFIGLAFMVILGLFMGSMMANTYAAMGAPALASGFYTITFIIMAAIYVMPIYYLYQFSVKIQDALKSNNTSVLTNGLGYLKSHYKYVGILMIVMLSLYVFAIIFGIVMTAAAGFATI